METKFNSQICTSRSQSERILALGLKMETADMVWLDYSLYPDVEDWRICADYEDWGTWQEGGIPAWSLHRLIILIGNIACDWIFRNDDYYTNAINCIEWLIKKGYFNKEYLV